MERERFEAWLRERGCWWDPRIRLVAPSDDDASTIAHGWGVVAVAPVRRGEVVFQIPRKACFGARAAAAASDQVDSQAALVCALLRERALGARSKWAALLRTLPADVPTPWRWSEAEQAWLRGTELERPLACKLERLEIEYVRALRAGELGTPAASFDAWCAGCACVISHVNPWWGGCIAPFACMLNAPDLARGQAAGVAYELSPDGRALVGVALETLAAGAEVTQGYGEEAGAADLIYRYGFCFEPPPAGWPAGAPRPADVVSVTARHLSDAARAVARGGWLEATAGGARGEAVDTIDAHLRENAAALSEADLAERLALLARAAVLQQSPWDGLDAERSIELGRAVDDAGMVAPRAWRHAPGRWPDPPPGLAELLVASTVLFALRPADWARARGHIAARDKHAAWRALGLDETDCVALALAVALHALSAGEWPPAPRLEGALAARLVLARAQAKAAVAAGGDGAGESESESESESGSDDDEDEPLWEVLAPSEPCGAALGRGFAFASMLAVRAAQAVVDRARFHKYRTIPRVGADEPSHALVPTMVETLHALELSILHGCSLVLGFHAQRLARAGGGGDEPPGAARPTIDDPCAAWRRLPVPYPR